MPLDIVYHTKYFVRGGAIDPGRIHGVGLSHLLVGGQFDCEGVNIYTMCGRILFLADHVSGLGSADQRYIGIDQW